MSQLRDTAAFTRRRFVTATGALLALGSSGLLTAFQTTPAAPAGSPAAPAGPQGNGSPAVNPQPIDWARINFLGDNIAPNFYTLTGVPDVDPGHPDGAGGRIGVLVGADGIFMVDASYAPVTDKVVAAIRKFSAEPVRYLVNTHSHPDHTGGNPNIVKLGALLLARETAREQISQPLPAAAGDAASRTDPARLPVVTYGLGEPVNIRMNGETIHMIPVRPAHTSGDSLVRFENADVIMIGDFYRNYGYPFVDTTNGGTLAGVLEALDVTMQLSGPDTRLVPGHGTMITRTDLVPYHDMILDVQATVQQMIDAGKSQDEVLAAKVTASYDAQVAGGLSLTLGVTTADRFVSAMYAELMANT
jgi:glyoxylase-like metal-dependent hydrolase (beta-lactamase superfamily II)